MNEDQDEYKVISQCFLNGWMYGKGPIGILHPHAPWWEEEAEEIILVSMGTVVLSCVLGSAPY